MKNSRSVFCSVLIGLFFLSAGSADAQELKEGIPLSQVPENVLNAAQNEISGIKLLDATKIIQEDGQTIYIIDGALGQKSYEVKVSAQGNVLREGGPQEILEDIQVSRVPGNILLAIRQEIAGLKVVKAKAAVMENGETIFELIGLRDQEMYRIRIKSTEEIVEAVLIPKSERN